MATIKSKIIVNIAVISFTIIGIVAMNYVNLKDLSHLQDVGAERARDAVNAKEASMGGMALYQVIADAEINRELDQTAKVWSEKKAEVLKAIEVTIKAADTPEEKKTAEEAKSAVEGTVAIFEQKMLPLLKSSVGLSAEIRDLDSKIDSEVKKTAASMDKVVDLLQKETKATDDEFDKEIKKIIVETLIVGLLGVLLQAALSGWLLKTIMKPINSLSQMLTDITQDHDLTKRLDVSGNDEIAQVGRVFNYFIDKFQEVVSHISSTSNHVATAANQLHSTSEQIATGAEEVAAQAGNVATAGEEMSATSGDIANNCHMASEGAHRASQTASKGAAVVENTIAVMAQIAAKVQETAKTVESLGARSDQIGAIIGTIEDIADQTNLLALNAAIEAARAGEQGRGFAVVADEVRALAERTTNATREIGEMIKAIQKETNGAVVAMEQGVHQVEAGTEEAAKSGAALQEILAEVNELAMQINQVATAAEEQTATTSEISSNMHQITQVVQQTSQGAQESAVAAAQLSGNAEELRRLVNQFRL